MRVQIEELKVPARKAGAGIDRELVPWIARFLGVQPDDILRYTLLRRSLDARKKPDVQILYRLHADLKPGTLPRSAAGSKELPEMPCPAEYVLEHSSLRHPLIVGAGPAGLFAAWVLARAGCCPVVLERGRDVTRRKADIDRFFATRELDTESNLLYGEGGAGTWSDGKLFTRIRDERIRLVLDQFIRCGAQEEIRYFSHPHIGSDRLPDVIRRLREDIIAHGGEFHWDSNVTAAIIRDGKCCGVRLASGEALDAPCVMMAPGHSARQLILNLTGAGVTHKLKGFQIGSRIEHPQSFINQMQFGDPGRQAALGAAEYSISSSPAPNGKISGAVSFCMCPGGEILPATCEMEHLCTNGMSNSARDGEYADAALVASISGDRFPNAGEAFHFIESLEAQAYQACAASGAYTAPAQSAEAFLRGSMDRRIPGEASSYRMGVQPYRVDRIMPEEIRKALQRALVHFDRCMPGFIREGLFIGLETRVSSPVRFERDPETLSSSVRGLYLAGEGAGMAGGITSAAVDGIRLAEKMAEQFR